MVHNSLFFTHQATKKLEQKHRKDATRTVIMENKRRSRETDFSETAAKHTSPAFVLSALENTGTPSGSTPLKCQQHISAIKKSKI